MRNRNNITCACGLFTLKPYIHRKNDMGHSYPGKNMWKIRKALKGQKMKFSTGNMALVKNPL